MLDRIFTSGIVFLILVTPFAFGSVQPWAYTTMEVMIFALVIVWMAKRAMLARGSGANTEYPKRNTQARLTPYALPLTLFILLCAMQLLPLPPSFLKLISPQTFEVYRQSLPAWPERVSYSDLASAEQRAGSGGQSAKREEQGLTVAGRRSSVIGSERQVEVKDKQNATNATNAQRNNASDAPNAGALFPETWLPLSISTGLTKTDLLKFTAFAALFFLVWRYPFEDFGFRNSDFGFRSPQSAFFVLSPEQRFLRSIVFAVLAAGLLVAAFGFVERFAWNGNVLLWVAGYEPGAPGADTAARASGPFINPDHFANYLSLSFPLALGCALFPTFMVSHSHQYGLKIFCGFTTFLVFTAILLSLSRGGWMSTLLGISIFAWLAPWGTPRENVRRKGSAVRGNPWDATNAMNAERNNAIDAVSQSAIRSSNFSRAVRLSLVTLCILLIVSLFLAGQGGREQVDVRLGETLEKTDLGLGVRVTVILKEIPKMIMDFPLFGVGLGAWPELFLHYRSGPWSTVFFREAHNDYLEALAETGFIGFGLLGVFFYTAGRRLVRGARRSSLKYVPLVAAILAALGGMAIHEWLDFSLQIPANAFLFTVLLAVGMRMAKSKEQRASSEPWPDIGDQRSEISLEQGAWSREPNKFEIRNPQSAIRNPGALRLALSSMRAGASALPAAVLLICATLQDQYTYPYNLREMSSLAQAKAFLLEHPTHSPYHFSLVRLAGPKAPLEWQLAEAKAALWNEPVNPYYRDFYAATLMAMGKTEVGLQEVARSVAESPSLSTHAYLSTESLSSLNDAEQAAVQEGFRQALSRSYPEALSGLAEFYGKFERFQDQAALYEQTARKETDKENKITLLIESGMAYLRAQHAEDKKSEVRGQRPAEDIRREAPGVRRDATNATNAERNNAMNAERLFREAIALNPKDPKPYHLLLNEIFAARNDFDGAKKLVAKAVQSGAPPLPLYLSLSEALHKGHKEDESRATLELASAEVEKRIQDGESPYTLYIALADGARRAGDREHENAALLKALDRQPRSPETLVRLANVYMEQQNYDRAAMYLNRVTEITPNSADLFYRIAQAEEAGYRFAAAGRAYARALELAPKNDGYRERYSAFKRRVEEYREEDDRKISNFELRIAK